LKSLQGFELKLSFVLKRRYISSFFPNKSTTQWTTSRVRPFFHLFTSFFSKPCLSFISLFASSSINFCVSFLSFISILAFYTSFSLISYWHLFRVFHFITLCRSFGSKLCASSCQILRPALVFLIISYRPHWILWREQCFVFSR